MNTENGEPTADPKQETAKEMAVAAATAMTARRLDPRVRIEGA